MLASNRIRFGNAGAAIRARQAPYARERDARCRVVDQMRALARDRRHDRDFVVRGQRDRELVRALPDVSPVNVRDEREPRLQSSARSP